MIEFILNNTHVKSEQRASVALLDFIRYHKNLTGTKIGCREGDCGACSILIGEIKDGRMQYTSATSCLMPLGNAHGKHIVTIEGLNLDSGLNGVQHAFAEQGATQCGFCTPGFIVSLCGYCLNDSTPQVEKAIDAMNGNICRCTGYKSIERAAADVQTILKKRQSPGALEFAVQQKLVPDYFLSIKGRLEKLQTKRVNGQTTARIVGGGTDLYVQQHDTIIHEDVQLLFDRAELNGMLQREDICEFGAACTVTNLAESEIFQKSFPDLGRFIKLVSSTQIRNMATIAGNLVNASPIGDFSVFFLALDAQLILSNGVERRQLPLRKFYKGYKELDKMPAEFIEKVFFKIPGSADLFNFEKVSKRTHLDIASVNSAIVLSMDEGVVKKAGLSAGGVAPVPAYLEKCSGFLADKKITAETLSQAIRIAQSEIKPISDARGTAEYKRRLLTQLIKAHFITLFPQLEAELIYL